jgi:hypothetical protein
MELKLGIAIFKRRTQAHLTFPMQEVETRPAFNAEQKVGNSVANGGFPSLVRANNQVNIRFSPSVRTGKVDGTISEYAIAYEVEATKAHDYRDPPSPAIWAIILWDTFSN